jgi:ABC-type phosphate transport system permease subunit
VPPCRSASPPVVYLEEYAKRNWLTDIIEINITNLAGVPSIVYGLLALGIFVYSSASDRASSPPA